MFGNDLEQEVIWNSEVFKNFLQATANQEINQFEIEKQAAEEVEDSLIKLQDTINSNPMLKKAFQELKERAILDPSFREQIGEGITNSLIILDI